tara:strand:- start:4724 stop:5554 length:831 start_codon:yes stop_codon:yes gene_type:complete
MADNFLEAYESIHNQDPLEIIKKTLQRGIDDIFQRSKDLIIFERDIQPKLDSYEFDDLDIDITEEEIEDIAIEMADDQPKWTNRYELINPAILNQIPGRWTIWIQNQSMPLIYDGLPGGETEYPFEYGDPGMSEAIIYDAFDEFAIIAVEVLTKEASEANSDLYDNDWETYDQYLDELAWDRALERELYMHTYSKSFGEKAPEYWVNIYYIEEFENGEFNKQGHTDIDSMPAGGLIQDANSAKVAAEKDLEKRKPRVPDIPAPRGYGYRDQDENRD